MNPALLAACFLISVYALALCVFMHGWPWMPPHDDEEDDK